MVIFFINLFYILQMIIDKYKQYSVKDASFLLFIQFSYTYKFCTVQFVLYMRKYTVLVELFKKN